MNRVTEYNSLEALEELRPRWQALLAQTPHASFFQSYEWLVAQWRHVGHARQLRVLAVWENGDTVGILPFNIQPEQLQIGPTKTLNFPMDGWGSFYGPIGAEPNQILALGLEHIRNTPRNHDVIDLRALPVVDHDHPLYEDLGSFTEYSQVGMLDLHSTWNDYWQSRRQDYNRWRNIERCERRLTEQGNVTYLRYRPAGLEMQDAAPRWDLYDACENLAKGSWQSGLVEGNTLSHAHVREFLRDAHVAAVNSGALDLNLLFLNDRPIAFAYGYHYRGYLDVVRIGFDPDFAKVAPGNALWTHMIRDSYQRGDRVMDLGPTCLDYKKFWVTRIEPSYRYIEYPLTPRSQMLRVGRWLRMKLSSAPKPEQTNQAAKEEVARRAKEELATPQTHIVTKTN